MHESPNRLVRLADEWPLVCLGSSGEYAKIGDARWHERMTEAMNLLCGDGPPPCALHMLRGLAVSRSGAYPFASADSSSIAQNHAGNNTRATPPKDVRRMADNIDAHQTPARWRAVPTRLAFDEERSAMSADQSESTHDRLRRLLFRRLAVVLKLAFDEEPRR